MTVRADWIEKREAHAAAANGNRNISQMHFARQGVTTEEMQYVAKRERLEPELIRSEVARGRCIIPANIHHRNLEPMAIGIATKCKINANIGNSATSSNIDEELKKLHHAVHYGADTVMDLSTGGDIPTIRKAIIDASPVPVGTVPVYEAISLRTSSGSIFTRLATKNISSVTTPLRARCICDILRVPFAAA